MKNAHPRLNPDQKVSRRWEGDFSVRIRSRGYQPPENHRWEVSLSTGIGITKHYAVMAGNGAHLYGLSRWPTMAKVGPLKITD